MVKTEAGNPSTEEHLDSSTFDPERWNMAMGNLFWRTVLNSPYYLESQIEGAARGFLGRKGYYLVGIGGFIKSVIDSPSAPEPVRDDNFTFLEQMILDLPGFEKTSPNTLEHQLSEAVFLTYGGGNIVKARYLRMRDAFIKLGDFPPDLFSQNEELVRLFAQAAFSRELEGGGASYNRSHHKGDEKVIQASYRHGLMVAAELANYLPEVEDLNGYQ